MPSFKIENKGGKKGRITIEGEITWWKNSSGEFIRKVDSLLSEGVQDVEVYINSPGGSVFDANEIGNQIGRFAGERSAELGALCASAGTLISCYCDTVKASANTQFMIHDPISYAVITHMEEWDSNKQMYENLRNTALDLYAQKTGLDRKVLDEMMRKTTWLTAKQAKEKGFVNEVGKQKAALPKDAKNVLQQYKEQYGSVPATFNYVFEPDNKNELITNNLTPTIGMDEFAKMLGLPENATKEQIAAAVAALKNNAPVAQTPPTAATPPAAAEPKNANNAAIEAVVALGETKGLKADWVRNLAKADLQAALDMVKEFQAPVAQAPAQAAKPAVTAAEILKLAQQGGAQAKKPEGRENWTFNDWRKKDAAGLAKMKKETPDAYAQLRDDYIAEQKSANPAWF